MESASWPLPMLFEGQGIREISPVRPPAQDAVSAGGRALPLQSPSGGRPSQAGLCSESAVIELNRHLWPQLAGPRDAGGLGQNLRGFTAPALQTHIGAFVNRLRRDVLSPALCALGQGATGWGRLEGLWILAQTQRRRRQATPAGRTARAHLPQTVELGPGVMRCLRPRQQLPAPALAPNAAVLP